VRIRRTRLGSLLVVLVAVLASACGSADSEDSSTAAPAATAAATAAPEGDAAAAGSWRESAAVVDELLTEKGTFESPPTTAPKPEPGKKLALISCGQTITACSYSVAAAAEAAKSIGWTTTTFDAKGDPNVAGTGIRQAVAAGVDGIYTYYLDCKYMRSALREAKAADIPVVAAEGVDCDKAGGDAEGLFTAEVTYVGGDDYLEYIYGWEATQFQYPIAKQQGKTNMIVFGDDTTIGSNTAVQAAKDTFAKCDTCTLRVEEFPITDFGTKLQQIAQEAILKTPDVNAVAGTYEAVILLGVEAAVRASGKEVILDIGEGNAEAMDLIRSGRATYGAGLPVEWEGYAGIDSLVRLFAGEEPKDSGIGLQLFDQEHNMPAKGGYVPPFDYRAIYREAWGVGA
jgi:ribose transport system substrate-binding protein